MQNEAADILNIHNRLLTMTDDTGMFQHCKYGVPDRFHGYATDDNCRALILVLWMYEKQLKQEYIELMYIYTAFMLHAQNDKGMFRNFMDYNRSFKEVEGSEDCFGRCIWTISEALASEHAPRNIKEACKYMLNKAISNVPKIKCIRARSYLLMGLCSIEDETFKPKLQGYISQFVQEILNEFHIHSTQDWIWPEEVLTYSNAIIPLGLFKAWNLLKEDEILHTATQMLDFLLDKLFSDGYFKPVGCKGWMFKDGHRAKWDEQPLEASEMLLACLEANKCTKERKYLFFARKCFEWYKGANSGKYSMIDQESFGCFDGITETGVNLNQGAESIISYGMAALLLEH